MEHGVRSTRHPRKKPDVPLSTVWLPDGAVDDHSRSPNSGRPITVRSQELHCTACRFDIDAEPNVAHPGGGDATLAAVRRRQVVAAAKGSADRTHLGCCQ